MSVQTELQRIIQAKADIIDSIEAKGVTVPSGTTIDNLDDYVDQIQQGGGGGAEEWSESEMLTVTALDATVMKTYNVQYLYNGNVLFPPIHYKVNNGDWQVFQAMYSNNTIEVSLAEGDTLKYWIEWTDDLPAIINLGMQSSKYINGFYKKSGRIKLSGHVDAIVGPQKIHRDLHYGGLFSPYMPDGYLNAENINDLVFDSSCKGYHKMFYGWNQLVEAGNLTFQADIMPSLTEMFLGCSSLVHAPSIICRTTVSAGLKNMFQQCTSLTKAPVIRIEETASDSCTSMFYLCTALNDISDVFIKYVGTSGGAQYIYSGCTGLTGEIHVKGFYAIKSTYNDLTGLFSNCSNITSIYLDDFIYTANSLGNIINYNIDVYAYNSIKAITSSTFTLHLNRALSSDTNMGNILYIQSLDDNNEITYTYTDTSVAKVKYYDSANDTWSDLPATITLNQGDKLYLYDNGVATNTINLPNKISSTGRIKLGGLYSYIMSTSNINYAVAFVNNSNLVDISDLIILPITSNSWSSWKLPEFYGTGITTALSDGNLITTAGFSVPNWLYKDTAISGTVESKYLNANQTLYGTTVTKVKTTSEIKNNILDGNTNAVIVIDVMFRKLSDYLSYNTSNNIQIYLGKKIIYINNEYTEVPFNDTVNCYKLTGLNIKTGDKVKIPLDSNSSTIYINNTQYINGSGETWTSDNNYSTITIGYYSKNGSTVIYNVTLS